MKRTVIGLCLVLLSGCGGSEGPACGDGVCEFGENAATCAVDCQMSCGDGLCTGGENARTCDSDCPAQCGDGACSHDEVPSSCPADCGTVCGDFSCTGAETAQTCATDCPPTCGDAACTHTETAVTCPADCDPVCGDGMCASVGESCTTCSTDCGVCPPSLIDVRIIGVHVLPFDNEGANWDGLGSFTQQEQFEFVSAANSAGGPFVAAAAFAALLVNEGTSAADVRGVGNIAYGQTDLMIPLTLTGQNNTNKPTFGQPAPGWNNVQTGRDVRISIDLHDYDDTSANCVIGVVQINEQHLLAALSAAQNYPVPVVLQGSQIAFVIISASAAAP